MAEASGHTFDLSLVTPEGVAYEGEAEAEEEAEEREPEPTAA